MATVAAAWVAISWGAAALAWAAPANQPAGAKVAPDPAAIAAKSRQLLQLKHQLRGAQTKLDAMNRQERMLAQQVVHTADAVLDAQMTLDDIWIKMQQVKVQLSIVRRNVGVLKDHLAYRQATLRQRLRDVYETTDTGLLDALWDAPTLPDFLARYDLVALVVEDQQQAVQAVQAERSGYQAMERTLTSKMGALWGLRQELTGRAAKLKSTKRRWQAAWNQVALERAAQRQAVVELEEISQQAEAELQAYIQGRQAAAARRGQPHRNAGAVAFSWPLSGRITSGFGWRVHPMSGSLRFHTGLDLAAHMGDPIRAAAGGVVIYAGWYDGYGNAVVLDHGGGYATLYGHCSWIFVSDGQAVSRGAMIAAVGSTGVSTGPHLHFELRQGGVPIDPRVKLL